MRRLTSRLPPVRRPLHIAMIAVAAVALLLSSVSAFAPQSFLRQRHALSMKLGVDEKVTCSKMHIPTLLMLPRSL